MPDICVFYASEDRNHVQKIVTSLTEYGWTVWWDQSITTGKWPAHVEKAISESRCAVPVWSKTSVDPTRIIVNETQHALDLGLDILPIKIDDTLLPIQFNQTHTIDLTRWTQTPSEYGLKELLTEIEKVIGTPKIKFDGNRPTSYVLGGSEIKLPCFVRSVSSFETQLDPVTALKLLRLMPASDPILVSAYDIYLPQRAKEQFVNYHKELMHQLKAIKERNQLLILDSGNYEAYRKDRKTKWTKKGEKVTWTEAKFIKALKESSFSCTFCFDNLKPSKDSKSIVADVVSRVTNIESENVFPIVHVPQVKTGQYRRDMFPEIIYTISAQINPDIIAIPERELGDGIFERAQMIKKIRKPLNKLDRYQPIHILGTGNPITIIILAAAGADFFDGLEWCRTVVDRQTGLLFHHQQYDFFQKQTQSMSRFNFVRDAVEREDILVKMALHNLDFFHVWMEEIQDNIENDKVGEMLAHYLPKHTYMDIRNSLSGILDT